MKLADLINKLQKLAKENDIGASHNVVVYNNCNGHHYDIDVTCIDNELQIEISAIDIEI